MGGASRGYDLESGFWEWWEEDVGLVAFERVRVGGALEGAPYEDGAWDEPLCTRVGDADEAVVDITATTRRHQKGVGAERRQPLRKSGHAP